MSTYATRGGVPGYTGDGPADDLRELIEEANEAARYRQAKAGAMFEEADRRRAEQLRGDAA